MIILYHNYYPIRSRPQRSLFVCQIKITGLLHNEFQLIVAILALLLSAQSLKGATTAYRHQMALVRRPAIVQIFSRCLEQFLLWPPLARRLLVIVSLTKCKEDIKEVGWILCEVMPQPHCFHGNRQSKKKYRAGLQNYVHTFFHI